jgi:hypothetical protein
VGDSKNRRGERDDRNNEAGRAKVSPSSPPTLHCKPSVLARPHRASSPSRHGAPRRCLQARRRLLELLHSAGGEHGQEGALLHRRRHQNGPRADQPVARRFLAALRHSSGQHPRSPPPLATASHSSFSRIHSTCSPAQNPSSCRSAHYLQIVAFLAPSSLISRSSNLIVAVNSGDRLRSLDNSISH